MEDRTQVDTVYTDDRQCFDRIDHYVLLKQSKSVGMQCWFLIENRQFICIVLCLDITPAWNPAWAVVIHNLYPLSVLSNRSKLLLILKRI